MSSVASLGNPAHSSKQAMAEEMRRIVDLPMSEYTIIREELNKAKTHERSAWRIDNWLFGSIVNRRTATRNRGE
jgi:hypothetical protein